METGDGGWAFGLGPLGDMLGNIKYGDLPQGTSTYRIVSQLKGAKEGGRNTSWNQ
jgi:hypothetical protein